MTESPTAALTAEGVSIWLDDLSRQRIHSGGLDELIAQSNVVGITTNPTIFATALSNTDAYDEQLADLALSGSSVSEAVFEITTSDVADACDVFLPVYEATNGLDGRVSIEVSPDVAHDVEGTVAQARHLRDKVDRPNAFIKIPATAEGLDAIAATTAEGISINVTLIFSLQRYRDVIDAYLSGLERALEAGIELGGIRSVASFFVSRVDTEVDKRLDRLGSDAAASLKHKAGIANARLAYEIFEQEFAGERAQRLLGHRANLQRPLWASTGVKDPAMPDTAYIVELVAPNIVNTMPEKTLTAVRDHGVIRGDTVAGTYADSRSVLDELAALGISYDDVTATLETEGVEKFTVSWDELAQTVANALRAAS